MKPILAAAIALVLGLMMGFLLGRMTLERQWSSPYSQVSPAAQQKSAGGNPSPKAGTKVLIAMPIARTRRTLETMTAKDPVVSTVASVGSSSDGAELHVTVQNRGTCTVTSLAGVAYGFDAVGKPAPLNKGGETYVAFASKELIEPGKKAKLAEPLKDIELATLAVAHVDHTTCADGTSWTRQ
jgi:hypothetical protein